MRRLHGESFTLLQHNEVERRVERIVAERVEAGRRSADFLSLVEEQEEQERVRLMKLLEVEVEKEEAKYRTEIKDAERKEQERLKKMDEVARVSQVKEAERERDRVQKQVGHVGG